MANHSRLLRFVRWFVHMGATPVACGKGLPGRRVMAQNSLQDGHG
jgi:hypothetical protein